MEVGTNAAGELVPTEKETAESIAVPVATIARTKIFALVLCNGRKGSEFSCSVVFTNEVVHPVTRKVLKSSVSTYTLAWDGTFEQVKFKDAVRFYPKGLDGIAPLKPCFDTDGDACVRWVQANQLADLTEGNSLSIVGYLTVI